MGRFSREEIEMFCLARLINCYIDTDPENNFIDWCAPRSELVPACSQTCFRKKCAILSAVGHRMCM